MNKLEIFKNGITTENPILVQQVGMCATLAITTSLINGIGMGDKIRIPAFIVVIATFVTIVQMLLKAYVPSLDSALGLYIPLIVVNCIILARAEAFAFKNGVVDSTIDGLGMGIGYLVAMILLSSIREILGNGTILGLRIFPEAYEPMMMAIQPPGAFILLGLLIGLVNYLSIRKKA